MCSCPDSNWRLLVCKTNVITATLHELKMLKRIFNLIYFKNFKVLFSSRILHHIRCSRVQKYINFLFYTTLNIFSTKNNCKTYFVFPIFFFRENFLLVLLSSRKGTKKFKLYLYGNIYISNTLVKKQHSGNKLLIQKHTYFIKLKHQFGSINFKKYLSITKGITKKRVTQIYPAHFKIFDNYLYSNIIYYSIYPLFIIKTNFFLFF